MQRCVYWYMTHATKDCMPTCKPDLSGYTQYNFIIKDTVVKYNFIF